MNVLVVARYFPPDLGGSATRAYNLAKGLSLNGCNVTVIAAFPHYPLGVIPREYKWKPLKVEWMGKIKIIRTFMLPIKSEGFFKRLVHIGVFAVSSLFALPFVDKVDAVWASSWVPGYVYAKLKNCLVALNVDDLTLEDLIDLKVMKDNSPSLKIAEWVYRLFFVKGDILTPISSGYRKIMEKKYCVDPDRIRFVRGGVDLSVFKPAKSRLKSQKEFVVLYSGAFSIAYNFDQIFKAARIIQDLDPHIKFVVQGTGELFVSMQASLSKLKVKNVTLINKILSRLAVAKQLAQADVLVLPLVEFNRPYRGMSSKLYEYQAVGRPIISCSRGLPSAYVKGTNSGLAVYPGDAEALAKAILELKDNPGLAATMGQNGRRFVENEASIEAIGLRMKEIFLKTQKNRELTIQ